MLKHPKVSWSKSLQALIKFTKTFSKSNFLKLLYQKTNDQLLSESNVFIVFYQRKASQSDSSDSHIFTPFDTKPSIQTLKFFPSGGLFFLWQLEYLRVPLGFRAIQ